MSEVPKLKTGAPAQYPSVKKIQYRTEVLRFVDGSEQRYRQVGMPVRRWQLSWRVVDEEEAERLSEFFHGQQGSYGNFSFKDPWTGEEYEAELGTDLLELEERGESNVTCNLAINERRA